MYMNPALSIRLPIFTIHGNHDDPCGLEYFSNIDMVSSNNYVNYFGKITNIEEIVVDPILFYKNETKIALYGIGHLKDERLNIAFEQKKIRFRRPKGDPESWFNILVIHQNRYKGLHCGVSRRQSLSEDTIPGFFNFVLWAHEHECIPTAYECEDTSVHFLQPGSTVQTSLVESESRPKMAFLLEVYKTGFKLSERPLSKYRPLIFQTIELADSKIDQKDTQKVEKYISDIVNKMIDKANILFKDRPESFRLPLIRLKIEGSGYDVIRCKRLASNFADRIANLNDFLQFYKKSINPFRHDLTSGAENINQKKPKRDYPEDSILDNFENLKPGGDGFVALIEDNDSHKQMIEKMMDDCFYQNKYLHLVPKNKFYSILDKYVSSNETNSINDFVDHEVFKKCYIELRRYIKSNNGSLMREGDGMLVTMDDRIIEICRDFMKVLCFGTEKSEEPVRRKRKKTINEEEIIDNDLPTMIPNSINEKNKHAKYSELDPIDNEDYPTEVEVHSRQIQYGSANYKLIESSDEENHRELAENILNSNKNIKKSKGNGCKKKREKKNSIIRANDINDGNDEIGSDRCDTRESVFINRKSAFASNKNTEVVRSTGISKFKKDPMAIKNTVKINEEDFMNQTMKNKKLANKLN